MTGRIGGAVLLGVLLACGGTPAPEPAGAELLVPEAAAPVPGAARRPPLTFAVLINGGGSRARNYQSHLLQVRELIALLRERGIAKQRIWIFTSDGESSRADLAVRDLEPDEDFWLIQRTRLGRNLRASIHYENTTVDEKLLIPATRKALWRWARNGARKRLRAGDTLLVYVTDHGSRNREDPSNSWIDLWGDRLSVSEYRAWVGALPRGVRVVSLMSQCYSGSFGGAMIGLGETGETGETEETERAVCGYFSSAPDRRAYGCYPENLGKENVGHSFRFFEGLRIHGSLAQAHEQVLLTDRTPDVPNRTSDLFLGALLALEARSRGVDLETLVDGLLARVSAGDPGQAAAFEQIDRIGRAFGSFSPRSLAGLRERATRFPAVAGELRSYARRWRAALADLERENLEAFLEVRPGYARYAGKGAGRGLGRAEKQRVRAALLADLEAFTRAHPARYRRLQALHRLASRAADAGYRMEVREAVALRIRLLLIRLAGRILVQQGADASARGRLAEILACEDLSLGAEGAPPRRRAARESSSQPPFPPLEDEGRLLEQVLPGWIGIGFRAVSDQERARDGLPRGTVRVETVYADSPASRAGFEVGDIVLGPPGKPFVERHQIREWVMTSVVGEERSLQVLRGGERIELRVTIGRAPI